MAIKVATVADSAHIRRATTLNYNAAYTVTFRFYYAAASNNNLIWGICGSSGSNSGNDFGTQGDKLYFKSGGGLIFDGWDGTDLTSIDTGVFLSTGQWHSLAIVRSAINSVKVRVNGTDYSTGGTADMTGRESVAYEFMLSYNEGGGSCAQDVAVTNYKAWQGVVGNGTTDVDAEMLTTSFVTSTNKYSGSPMGDAATLAGNLTADNGKTAWTNGANVTYAANDPSVTYGGGSQILLPASDITTTGWTTAGGGSLYAAIDEAVASDSDYIYTGTLNAECEVKLQPGSTPGSGSQNLKVRCPAGFTPVGNWSVSLYQGASLVQAFTTPAPAADTTASFSVTNSITDYSDLRVRIKSTA